MINFIQGTVRAKRENYAVVEAGGVGYKILTNSRTLKNLPAVGEAAQLFCHLHLPEGGMDLYGFVDEAELYFFEKLISVSGVGPKSALNIMSVADLSQLTSAIAHGRADLLTQASGVGRKTAERLIIELKDKVSADGTGLEMAAMDADREAMEALSSLGFTQREAKEALRKVSPDIITLEGRIKAALRMSGKR